MDKDLLGILKKTAGLLRRPVMQIALAAFLFQFAGPFDLLAGDLEDRRAWVALDVFPSLVAADRDILSKTGPDGNLVLLVLYIDKRELAEDMAARLRKIENIRGAGIRVEIAAGDNPEKFAGTRPAGIFIAQKMGRELDAAVRFGTEKSVVVFSPFEEDIERGAHAGILISDRVVPLVNLTAVRESKIRIKPFYLRIAEKYE